jgi:glycosyltransferase involved in cell wall biosynthesis
MAARLRRSGRAVADAVRDFRPDAVLTVPHQFLWSAAADAAGELGVPLHLIVHDDWPSLITFRRSGPIADLARWSCRARLGRVYRRAAARLCVSPGMEEQYRDYFGVRGTVLYPSRGDDSPSPRVRVRREAGGPPIVAFCGMIHHDGTAALVRELAAILDQLGGRLDLYTSLGKSDLAERALSSPAVRLRGFLPAEELGERIGESAHALFLPTSFEPRERTDVATLFPSKLADYTAIGLPVLIWAPADSSASRWARENPGATFCVTDRDSSPVRSAVMKLASDPSFAAKIAEMGIAAGNRSFDLAQARRIFREAIRRPGACPMESA